jgi:Multiubiquitin
MEEKKEKTVTIFVNGTPEEVEKKEEITYDEVVTFAFPDFPQHPERNYSVKYTRGHEGKPEGILPPGGQVKVKDQMRFDVTPTGQS